MSDKRDKSRAATYRDDPGGVHKSKPNERQEETHQEGHARHAHPHFVGVVPNKGLEAGVHVSGRGRSAGHDDAHDAQAHGERTRRDGVASPQQRLNCRRGRQLHGVEVASAVLDAEPKDDLSAVSECVFELRRDGEGLTSDTVLRLSTQ